MCSECTAYQHFRVPPAACVLMCTGQGHGLGAAEKGQVHIVPGWGLDAEQGLVESFGGAEKGSELDSSYGSASV